MRHTRPGGWLDRLDGRVHSMRPGSDRESRPAAIARQHRAFTIVLTVGLLLRVLTAITYWPGVQFPDSGDYLGNAVHLGLRVWHPIGYPLFLALFAWTHQIGAVTVVQHVMGLTAGALAYFVLLRLGCRRGWAVAGCAPILLDPMQIYLEQYVLSDVLFMFLTVLLIAVAVLCRLTRRAAVAAGLLVAYTTTVRTIALVVAVPVAAYWLWQRVHWRTVVLAAVTAALPLLAYASVFDATQGAFSLQGYSGRWLYGRIAAIAHCSRDQVPAAARPMCPGTPASTRVLPSEWVWNARSPYASTDLPASDVTRSQLAGRFARAVIVHEPVAYVRTVARDVAYAFAPSREAGTQGWFTGSWRFYQPHQPAFWRTTPMVSGFWAQPVHGIVLTGPARVLHDYERFVFTPGLAGAIALAIGSVAAVARRRSRAGAVCALLVVSGLLLLVVPIATVDLDYRYVLSAQELFVAAGALGASMLAPAVRAYARRRGRWGRLGQVTATVAALVGMAAGNLGSAEAYAAGVPAPKVLAVGGTGVVSKRIAVNLAGVDVVGYRCLRHTVEWRYEFTVAARWLRGHRLLVAADDFTVRSRDPLLPLLPVGIVPRSPLLLRPYLISRAHPVVAGQFQIAMAATGGTLVYTDPLGAGDLAWVFHAPPQANSYPTPGAFCLTTIPGGG